MSRNRRDRRRFVEPEEPVQITDPDLLDLLADFDRRGRPEVRYRVIDRIYTDRDLDQAALYRELAGIEEGTEEPTGTSPERGGSEGSSEPGEVNGEADGGEGGQLKELPEIPDDASRDDLVEYAAQHLDLELPGNISKADALDAITERIEELTEGIEGNEG